MNGETDALIVKMFCRIQNGRTVPKVLNTRFTEAGELGPNKLFIFFVRGYLERYKVWSPNVRYGNPGDSMTKDLVTLT